MKRAIIIGASSGIGEQIARDLAEQGWTLGIAARRVEALETIQNDYGADRVFIEQIDVNEPMATEALDRLVAKVAAPDLFFYASGLGGQNPQLEESLELRIVKTNCEGMVRVVDHFLNYVKQESRYTVKYKAHIAVITSVAGTAGIGTAPAYSASKKMQSTYISALAQLCRMKKTPVVFSDIRPGFVDTAILNPNKHYPMCMSRQKASKCILKGLKRRRRVIIFDWRFVCLVAFWNLIPRWLWERLTFVKN